jgi:thermitase
MFNKIKLQLFVTSLLLIFLQSIVFAQLLKQNENDFQNVQAKESKYKYSPDQIIVKFKSYITSEDITLGRLTNFEKLNAKYGVNNIKQLFKTIKDKEKLNNLKKSLGLTQLYVLKVQKNIDIDQMVIEYKQDPDIEYAEPDYIVEGGIIPNDTYFNSNQWNLNNTGQSGGKVDGDIDAPEVWDLTTGDNSVIIAIIDSGVKLNHPDLSNKILPGYDFVNGDNDPSDDHGHGTHVAGIAAAISNNATGISGVCWNCNILPVKVLGSNNRGLTSNLISGIIYAVDNNADVINLSIAGVDTSAKYDAVLYAYNANRVIVACMGNDGDSWVYYTAGYKEVIAVGATDKNDIRASFSSYGGHIDVVAPGVSVYSTYLYSPYYAYMDGTSMATPHVAGLAALILSMNPSYNPDQVKWHIELGAEDQVGNIAEDTPGWDIYYGWGRINSYNSLQLISPGITFSLESSYANSNSKGVRPASGNISTIFTYKAIYFDDYNLPPSNIQVCIDESCHVMLLDNATTIERLRDGNYLNGEQFTYASSLPWGSHNYYFTTSNGTNSRTLPSIGVFNWPTVYDSLAPTGSIIINNAANYAQSTTVTLNLLCADTGGSGCAQMQFSNDNTNWSDPEDYSSAKIWTLTSGDGTKSVYVRYKDAAGNWSGTYSDLIVLDATAPSTTASPAGGTYTSAQNVTLTCNDGSGAGCASRLYCLGSGCTPTTPYSGAINISSSNTLRFYSIDNANNNESVKTDIYVIQSAEPLTITTSSVPSGNLDFAYSKTLTVTGGVLPYSWAISSGNLPNGLTLNSSTGAISGTPTLTGIFDFTGQVTDANASSAYKNLSITVLSYPVRITSPLTYYFDIQDAYDACFNGNIIQIGATEFTEDLYLDKNVSIVLKGGYDSNYTNNSSYTAVRGKLTITHGTVEVEKLIIQ